MRTANYHAQNLRQDGYQAFHYRHDLRCHDSGRHDPTECIWHRITRPIKEAAALSMLFQHGIAGFLRVRKSCYEYLKIDELTTRENWLEWPNIESLFLRAGFDIGVENWVACGTHYPWSVSSPSQIEERVKVLKQTFEKEDDCIFLTWLWRVISHNCRNPELLLLNGLEAETRTKRLVQGPHDMIFRSTGSISSFGALPLFPAWEALEMLRDWVD
ncbi:hypothetical protein LQW54_008524 [Pestalotiopsis sp. IQ-011]